jgi:methylenetetrahydrofolate reductase (NADPH)
MTVSRDRGLDGRSRAALVRMLQDPLFEVIPLPSVDAELAALPPGARVSITSSPGRSTEATLDLAERLVAAGFRVVPHLSAKMIRDRAHLDDVLVRCRALGLDHAFVVGGDPQLAGEFVDGLSLLRAMTELGHPFTSIGVPCYPEGHATIPTPALEAALVAKAPFASHATTQVCFDPRLIRDWVAVKRAEGFGLPIVIGIPGVTKLPRLLSISARIGVTGSVRFLRNNPRLLARLARSGGYYRPTELLEGLAPAFADPAAGLIGLHVYTFNAISPTIAWRDELLERLEEPSGG